MAGLALRMTLDIAALRLPAPTPCPLLSPLPDCDDDVYLEGLASPSTIDDQHTKFAPFCWTPFNKQIPLLLRHDPKRMVGRVDQLTMTAEGLKVRVIAADPVARRQPAFSIAATIHHYTIRPDHALVTCATLDEISLTDRPANRDALVDFRYPLPASSEFYDLLSEKMKRISQLVTQLQEQST